MRLEVGDGAGAALAAIEAELVVIGGAALGVLEAVRQQQQTALEIDGLDLFAPELVGDADHREAEILLAESQCAQQFFAHLLQVGLVSGLERSSVWPKRAASARTRSRISPVSGTTLKWAVLGRLSFFVDLGFDSGCHGGILRKESGFKREQLV